MATLANRNDWYVIVADDDPDWRSLMAQALGYVGFQVFEASNGIELVAHCRALLAIPTRRLLVIADVEMPFLSGVEALAQLSDLDADALRVVMITANATPRLVADARAAGVRAVMRKPVSRNELMRVVGTLAS